MPAAAPVVTVADGDLSADIFATCQSLFHAAADDQDWNPYHCADLGRPWVAVGRPGHAMGDDRTLPIFGAGQLLFIADGGAYGACVHLAPLHGDWGVSKWLMKVDGCHISNGARARNYHDTLGAAGVRFYVPPACLPCLAPMSPSDLLKVLVLPLRANRPILPQ